MKHLTKHAGILLMALLFAFSITSCEEEPEPAPTPDPDPELSSEAAITAFTFPELDPEVTATISGTDITATVPHGTDVTALSPSIAISEKATVNPASGVAQDFSSPVTYTVTAEDETEVVYTVTVTVEEPPAMVATALWQRNLVEGGVPDWFVAHQDRDLAAHGDFVYIQNNKQNIRVVSAADGTDVSAGANGFIDGTQNFNSGALPLLGTGTDSQGRIVASNLVVGSADLPSWNVYVWENKDADQELLFQFPTPEGYRLGENLSVVGDVRGDAIV